MKRLLAVLALIFAIVAAGAGPAFADELIIKKVDTTKFPEVAISGQLNGPPADLSKVSLRENGQFINQFSAVPLGRTNTPVGVVLVISCNGLL